jgi:MEMO1 family protein
VMEKTKPGGFRIRPAAVAGRFYPANPAELGRLIASFLENCPPGSAPGPKAVIAPHAGYIYSGPIAASAYALWLPVRQSVRRAVLLGPSHYVGFKGLAASSAEEFATPLGLVPVDVEGVRLACTLPQVQMLDDAHSMEHALEVQLPFLQVVLEEFKIVPLVVGMARAEEIAAVLDLFWGDSQTRFVISSDLSHYLDWGEARMLDEQTAEAIERLDGNGIAENQACGRLAIRGLLQAAARRGLRARTVDLRNSGDTAGPKQRVVGYGAFAFEEPAVK